jgi:hypothetical protein
MELADMGKGAEFKEGSGWPIFGHSINPISALLQAAAAWPLEDRGCEPDWQLFRTETGERIRWAPIRSPEGCGSADAGRVLGRR